MLQCCSHFACHFRPLADEISFRVTSRFSVSVKVILVTVSFINCLLYYELWRVTIGNAILFKKVVQGHLTEKQP